MDQLNRALSTYAAYFGIIAAILALGSWLATNYFGSRAQSASDSLKQAETDFRINSNFRQIYSLVNEETQTLDHVYTLLRDVSQSINPDPRPERERYNTLVRMGYIRHGERAMFTELERANQLVELVKLLDLPSSNLEDNAAKIYKEMSSLLEQRQAAKKKVQAAIAAAGDVYKLDEPGWQKLSAEIEAHRELVEIKLIPEQNRLWQEIASLESDILNSQRQEFKRRKGISSRVKRIALVLYIASALLALYGKWLEVRYPKPKEATTSVRTDTPANGSKRSTKT